MTLRDGTVVPHFLSMDHGQEAHSVPGGNNYALKTGIVVAVHYPDQRSNVRKDRIEYDVQVEERMGNKGFNINRYPNCIESNLFGGAADSIEWTYRPATTNDVSSASYVAGSNVLLLCLQGDKNCGVIIGGDRNQNRAVISTSARGHFFEFEFNGVNTEINKDGEMTLTYKSKTDIQGAPQDTVSGGTYIKIDKTGSVEIHDNDATWIKLDKTANKALINAGDAIRELAGVQYVANAPAMKFGGDGSTEPMVLGNQLVIFFNTQVIPKINALIAAVTTLAGTASAYSSHTHDTVVPTHGTITSTAPSATSDPTASGQIPAPATPSGPPQLSDFCFTKKSYEKVE